MASRAFSCPHCGLMLTLDDSQGRNTITYDPAGWRRLCRYPDLDSPALCLLEEGSNGRGGPPQPGRTRRNGLH